MGNRHPPFADRFRITNKRLDDGALPSQTGATRKRKSKRANIFKIIAITGIGMAIAMVLAILFTGPGTVAPPVKQNESASSGNGIDMLSQLERRMERHESALADISARVSTIKTQPVSSAANIDMLTRRLDRLEASINSRIDTLKTDTDAWQAQIANLQNRVRSLETADTKKATAPNNDNSPAAKAQIVPKKTGKSQKNAPSNARVYHVVQAGDTLYSVSQSYGTTAGRLIELNRFDKLPTLHAGDKLIVK